MKPDRNRLRRLAELDVFKLLHRTPKLPKQARNLLDELLDQGVRAKPAARVICAADADDPLSCAAAIADRPALSRSAKFQCPLSGQLCCCGGGGKWLDAKGFGGVLREPGQRV